MGHNALTGPVDLTQLPRSLTYLDLGNNQLTGAVDLTQLPAALEQLYMDQNQLTGAVDLTKLPTTLAVLSLHQNAGLTGVWRGDKRLGSHYDFDGTGITVVGA